MDMSQLYEEMKLALSYFRLGIQHMAEVKVSLDTSSNRGRIIFSHGDRHISFVIR